MRGADGEILLRWSNKDDGVVDTHAVPTANLAGGGAPSTMPAGVVDMRLSKEEWPAYDGSDDECVGTEEECEEQKVDMAKEAAEVAREEIAYEEGDMLFQWRGPGDAPVRHEVEVGDEAISLLGNLAARVETTIAAAQNAGARLFAVRGCVEFSIFGRVQNVNDTRTLSLPILASPLPRSPHVTFRSL